MSNHQNDHPQSLGGREGEEEGADDLQSASGGHFDPELVALAEAAAARALSGVTGGQQSLPSYLNAAVTRTDSIDVDAFIVEEQQESGGVDSDEECEDWENLEQVMGETESDGLEQDESQAVDDNDWNAIATGTRGAGLLIPSVPDDWVPVPRKADKGEPEFKDVDNPGGWSQFTFRPEFGGTGSMYKKHRLPTGATPVPKDPVTGKRTVGGWEFFYDGWKATSAAGDVTEPKPGVERTTAATTNQPPTFYGRSACTIRPQRLM